MSELGKMLRYDGLIEAEKITGQHYKSDSHTETLGFALSLLNEHEKGKALAASGDTHYGMLFTDTLRIFVEEGFQVVYRRAFRGQNDQNEHFLILWHPDGILGVLESFHEKTNTANIYYNIEFPGQVDHRVTSSGHLHLPSYDNGLHVYVGNHDVREGFRYRLRGIREAATFRKQWLERPFLWLLDHMEVKTPGYDRLAVIEHLPANVREAITPNEEN